MHCESVLALTRSKAPEKVPMQVGARAQKRFKGKPRKKFKGVPKAAEDGKAGEDMAANTEKDQNKVRVYGP
jgi:hypothetical protein